MPGTSAGCRYPSRWDERAAAELEPLERLVYRSNLLGGDRRLANASERAAKTTGNILNVDGGVPVAFPR